METNGNTVKLHRVLKAPPEKVFRALLEPEALAQWIPPYGFTCKIEKIEPVVGGKFRMSFTNFTTQKSMNFGGEYLEIIPNQLLKYTDEFDDPNLVGKILVSINLKKVLCGTDLEIIQENIPPAIPVEMCYLGWQESLKKLAHLTEPEINQ